MGVLQELRGRKDLTDTERQIRDFFLDHPEELFSLNTRQIGERTYTSAAAVTRFCKKMGFSGYADFRIRFVAEMNEQLQGKGGEERPVPRMERREGVASLMGKMSDVYREAIEHTIRNNPLDTVVQATILVHNASVVDLYGTDMNRAFMNYASYGFIKAGKEVQTFDDKYVSLHHALICAPDRLAIVISFTGENRQMLQICRTLHERHVRIILIARDRKHEMCSFADVVLLITCLDPERYLIDSEEFFTERYSTSLKFLIDLLTNVEFHKEMERNHALADRYNEVGVDGYWDLNHYSRQELELRERKNRRR